ncbi:MAG: hypothetical protein JWM40_1492 [Frankiales bacterium]|nr:hypothetical protein [Frankiales bacterium]
MKPTILPLAAALLLTCACGGSSAPAAALSPNPTATTPAPCPGGIGTFRWPTDMPAELPQPSGATFTKVVRQSGLTSVRFSSKTSLREGLLFVLRALPKTGYTIGRGDAEPAEADVPFGRGDLIGIYKLIVRGPCSTDWLVAVGHRSSLGGSPILPTTSPGPSSSPLPFG